MARIYLDNAATTPIDADVLKEMYHVMETYFGNPSSIHAHGREVRTLLEKARKKIALLLNVAPSEIFFTSGGTEADNTAIKSSILDLNISRAITSRIEHHAVLHTLEALARKGIVKLDYVDIDKKGNLNMEHLEELLSTSERSFVSLMHGNNEIGTLNDIHRIGELCESRGAIFHCDTVQTMGHYRHDVKKIKAHFLVCAAHKIHGPKGVGFIFISNNIKINPMILGGAQERNMRGGTENVYGIVGMAKALELAYADLDQQHQYIQGLKIYMIEQLVQFFPELTINGETDPDRSLYTVLNVSFPQTEIADMLLFNLDIAGISVSGGSACSSGTNIGSHVLEAINADPSRPAIRFSFSKYNTKEEIDVVVKKLIEIFKISR